jgi:hypothetical protein
VTVDDVFFRVGGAEAGTVATAFVDNGNNSIIDDSWIWRADHGAGAGGWTGDQSATGLVVNDPYEVPSQAVWMSSATQDGYPACYLPSSVTSFTGYGMGSYSYFDPRPRTSPPNARTPAAAALRGCGAISGDRRQPGR